MYNSFTSAFLLNQLPCPVAILQVIPMEEHAQKIAAARDAIGDADFFLVARTDARATSKMYGLQDAIARANLYMEVRHQDLSTTLSEGKKRFPSAHFRGRSTVIERT